MGATCPRPACICSPRRSYFSTGAAQDARGVGVEGFRRYKGEGEDGDIADSESADGDSSSESRSSSRDNFGR